MKISYHIYIVKSCRCHRSYMSLLLWQHKKETKGVSMKSRLRRWRWKHGAKVSYHFLMLTLLVTLNTLKSSIGDDQMQPTVDPYDPPYAQIFAADTQTKKWSQSDTDPWNPPLSKIKYHWLLQAPPCKCQVSWSEQINPSKVHDQEHEVPDEVMS